MPDVVWVLGVADVVGGGGEAALPVGDLVGAGGGGVAVVGGVLLLLGWLLGGKELARVGVHVW